MYDEKAKIRNDRYKKSKREKVSLDVPKGTKEKYKAYAASKGMSMTALITQIMEREMEQDGFNKTWAVIEEQEREEREAAMREKIDRIKAENAAAMRESMEK